jgi:hypothetical protein
MPAPLSGPGVGLPFPQNYYPSELQNAPQDPSSNRLALAPGDVFVLPAGDWYVSLGLYCVFQFLDPVTNVWSASSSAAYTRGIHFVKSDGFTVRVANLTGCVFSASVAAVGSGYVQATTTITAIGTFAGSAPTLVPIIGGALNIAGGTLTSNGAGYGVAPIVMIPPPPPAQSNANGVGGIQASAIAVISSGTVSSISITNPGAGYPSAPTPVIVPSPFDPNLSVGITNASVAFSLASSGLLMGALVTNNGSPLNNGSLGSITLSVGGAGTSASLTANVLQSVVSGTLSSAGTGYGTGGVGFVTYGGVPVAGGITNNLEANNLAWLPRPANIAVTAASVSLAAPATVYDGGLFLSAPTFAALNPATGGTPPTTVAGLAAVMGSHYDIAIIQQAP